MPLNLHAICVSCPITQDCSLADLAASTLGFTEKREEIMIRYSMIGFDIPPTFN